MTECGLSNLASCLPEKFFEYLLSILNAPLQPLLDHIKGLLTEPVNIAVFQSLWAVIIYIISIFYGLFFIFAGFNFMISGYDSAKREKAKEWLKNTVLMVFFVQASYFAYALLIELSALMTSGVVGIIDPNFFLLSADSFGSVGMQIIAILPYLLMLLVTALFLQLRYVLVAIGVVFFPIALFLYFIPALKAYGRVILNVLLIVIFIPFFDALVLFGASAMLDIPLLTNYKFLLMTAALFLIDALMVFLIVFAKIKAVSSAIWVSTNKVVKEVEKHAK